ERPMHPYEIAATLRMRHAEGSIKIRYGSLYTIIEGLQRECLVAVKEIVRDGRRPERTIYEITSAGQERMRTWLRDLIEIPVKEYPKFEAALSLLPAVPPAEAVALLEARSRRLGAMAEEIRALIEVVTKTVEPLFLVENEYRLTLVEAERQFIDDFLRRIAEDQTYTRAWKGFHPEPCRSAEEAEEGPA
ncbi:MAG: PadR family transcriptional regulator, partial [Isosphaeraceae bacterium]